MYSVTSYVLEAAHHAHEGAILEGKSDQLLHQQVFIVHPGRDLIDICQRVCLDTPCRRDRGGGDIAGRY